MYKLYLSTAMTGKPDHGYGQLNDAAAKLRKAGYAVTNPAELDEGDPNTLRWGACIIRDLQWLDTCDGIVLLEGWRESPGARIECQFALREGKQPGTVDYWLENAKEYVR